MTYTLPSACFATQILISVFTFSCIKTFHNTIDSVEMSSNTDEEGRKVGTRKEDDEWLKSKLKRRKFLPGSGREEETMLGHARCCRHTRHTAMCLDMSERKVPSRTYDLLVFSLPHAAARWSTSETGHNAGLRRAHHHPMTRVIPTVTVPTTVGSVES